MLDQVKGDMEANKPVASAGIVPPLPCSNRKDKRERDQTRRQNTLTHVVTYSPFTLFPSPVPKAAFLQALALQTHFNTLVDKISQDPSFLEEALSGTIQADDYIAKLFGIYKQVQQEVHCRGHILKSVGLLEESQRVPDNVRAPEISRALAKAWELYGQQKKSRLANSITVVLRKKLWKRDIPVIRRKFEEVSKTGCLDGDKRLFVDGLEVAVVYYRYGYMPDHYSEQGWDACLLMERSLAVKCPDIGTQLAGTKKVQQELARPGVLEKFFPDQPEVVDQIRETFAGLYTLDMGPEGDKTVAMALAAPDKFVLKPQREGGDNNIYGSQICRVLEGVKETAERAASILMDKINPTPVHNYLLRRDAPLQISSCLCELGMLGVYIRQGKDMVMNEYVGYLMRSKSSEHADGGVMAGVAVLDNPLLV
ncbi:hypothetical protein LDENG_00188230 [Lucifuga dentata]|nr:hypothetical protein LDENG_00188230 [Lucifuga dentata]